MDACYDVLCGCGWGRPTCPVDELPSECPQCGFSFDDWAADRLDGVSFEVV